MDRYWQLEKYLEICRFRIDRITFLVAVSKSILELGAGDGALEE